MSDDGPNDEQGKLIDGQDGIYAVDAGAGTGKTYSVTRRYARLLERAGVEPEDVLLVTFTNNAAMEMKERIVDHCEYGMAALRDAPIQTFHSFCHDLLTRDGVDAPTLLGIEDRITSETRVIENDVVEQRYFREFLGEFIAAHPEYHDYIRVLSRRSSLLDVIKELGSKGVVPTSDGWFRNGEQYLDGDIEAFRDQLQAQNEPNEGKTGPTQSDLRDALSGWGNDKCYRPNAPSETELRFSGPDNQANPEVVAGAFEEDRAGLKAFVHDVYFEYFEFALARNYVNFTFQLLLAFAVLCEDDQVREATAFEYVMVDEFQDTSEIQFKLALLLAQTNNLCVVGDWKQSIYSFQYAAVENIQQFETRLETFKAELNADGERVSYPADDVTWIRFQENYRSTQAILEFSEHSLTLEAVNREELDAAAIRAEITSLDSNSANEHSQIEAFRGDEEHDAILDRIQAIVDNDNYAVETKDGELRAPSFEDIAVLTRTRRFGREFQRRAAEFNIPVAYEGGVELFTTDQALLLLAWLRILEHEQSDRGWAVVLEAAGYTLDEVQHILEAEAYPDGMVAFREELGLIETIGGVARRVMDHYGFNDAYADALINTVETTFEQSTFNRGDVIQFIENSIEADSTVDVDDSPGTDSVTVQTLHAAKGLEHPIVIIANVNEHNFPSSGGSGDRIRYQDPIGLRQTKHYDDPHGTPHTYDSWRYDALSACFPPSYDEERRLMYVGMTRAKDHLLFSAGESPSSFFDALPIEAQTVEPDVTVDETDRSTQSRLKITVPTGVAQPSWTPHTLMDDRVFSKVDNGKGPEYGRRVHEFAEAIVTGDAPTPRNEDEEHLEAFLGSLAGDVIVEEPAYLPLTVDGEQITISGVIDLLHVQSDGVEIIDYKTDRGRHAEAEYQKQLSVYYHVVRQAYPNRNIEASIFYTVDATEFPIEPLSSVALETLIQEEQEGLANDSLAPESSD